jgi:hypothetical protein
MAYVGNNLTVQQYAPQIAYFSGNGSTTAFTLPIAVVTAAQILVVVANVPQNPSSSYSISGTTLTFTSAPPSGTNNIWVEYTSLQTNTIAPSNGTVSPASLTAGGPSWNSSYAFGVGATPSYGTAGQVLTSGGASAAPVWSNIPYQVQVYTWGGGAAGGGGGSSPNPAGGGGGAANGYLNVNPSQTLIAFVGGGGGYRGAGAGRGTAAAGGGGLTGTAGYGGGGGGYSGIFVNYVSQTTAVIVAGGGGGGGWDSSAPSGGSGGGTSGLSGGSGNPGTGGGQYSAGVGGGGNGSQLLGGNADDGDGGGGGGGGGGYWGGGAGTNNNPGSGGGGGSGYLNPAIVYNGTLTTGSGATPGDSGNSLRGSYGNGGNSGVDGTQGVTIIRYLGAQRGTGGTYSFSGGYSYHTFTSTGSNTYTA